MRQSALAVLVVGLSFADFPNHDLRQPPAIWPAIWMGNTPHPLTSSEDACISG